MNGADFNKLLEDRITSTLAVLATKEKEYAADNDRLHNFVRAAAMLNTTKAGACVGMWAKHVISILDIVDNIDKKLPNVELLNEKIGDAVNYLILLEAIIKEDIEKAKNV